MYSLNGGINPFFFWGGGRGRGLNGISSNFLSLWNIYLTISESGYIFIIICSVGIFLVSKCWNTPNEGLGDIKGNKVFFLELLNLCIITVLWLLSFLYLYLWFIKFLFLYRDLAGVLLELSEEFNIEKFLLVLLDSLIDCRCAFYDCLSGDICFKSYLIEACVLCWL